MLEPELFNSQSNDTNTMFPVRIQKNSYFPMSIISTTFVLIFLSSVDSTSLLAQTQSLESYENPELGISFQHPSLWQENKMPDRGCLKVGDCSISFKIDESQDLRDLSELKTIQIYTFEISVNKLDESCKCNTLKDYVTWNYNQGENKLVTFINDNQTTISNNHTAWQIQKELNVVGLSFRSYAVYAINGNVGYNFIYVGNTNAQFGKYLGGFKEMLKSVKFTPIESEKKPSFLLSSDTDNSTHLSKANNLNQNNLKILSSNEFTDSIGYLHVVGEVQNNTPQPAEFVKVTGTFYDSFGKVVATDFTYTNPRDIPSGEKAPFEMILTSSSIPMSGIANYRLLVVYNP